MICNGLFLIGEPTKSSENKQFNRAFMMIHGAHYLTTEESSYATFLGLMCPSTVKTQPRNMIPFPWVITRVQLTEASKSWSWYDHGNLSPQLKINEPQIQLHRHKSNVTCLATHKLLVADGANFKTSTSTHFLLAKNLSQTHFQYGILKIRFPTFRSFARASAGQSCCVWRWKYRFDL